MPSTKTDKVYVPPQPSFLFEHVLNPFYTYIVEYYPLWWTPNGLTVFGIGCTFLASMLGLSATHHTSTNEITGRPSSNWFTPGYYSPSVVLGWTESDDHHINAGILPVSSATAYHNHHISTQQEAERYRQQTQPATVSQVFSPYINFNSETVTPFGVLILMGILHWIYCIADNTDGKQARRLKKTSAIGEYLDHGLDCVTALLSSFNVVTLAGASLMNGGISLIMLLWVQVLSHLYHYETDELVWGTRFFSVDEGMIMFGAVPFTMAFLSDAIMPATLTLSLPSDLLSFVFTSPASITLRVIDVAWLFYAAGYIHMAVSLGMKIFTELPKERLHQAKGLLIGALGLSLSMCGIAGLLHKGGTTPAIAAQHIAVHNIIRDAVGAESHTPLSAATSCTGCPMTWPVLPLVAVVWKVFTSYPALWAMTVAFTGSTLCHSAIIAKCRHLPRLQAEHSLKWVSISILMFALSPLAGTFTAFVAHLAQITSTIHCLEEDKKIKKS